MKKIALLILALFTLGFCKAQNKPQPAANSLLWRISGNGLSKPSYLFGTAHLVCPPDYIWTDSMKAAFAQCTSLCLEMNITDQTELMKVMVSMMDNTGKKLESYFSATDYKRVAQYFKDSVQMDFSQFSRMKPLALTGIMEMRAMRCEKPMSYEQDLIKAATERNMNIDGLEDGDETVAIISHITTDSVLNGVMEMVNGNIESRHYHDMVMQAYKNQDIQTISNIARSQLGKNLNPLLNDRNKQWIGRMAGKMKKQQVFFAVGAGHLADKDGVINLLRKAGYKVEPVK